ncbi:uncharacterized protein B0T15DRAFT_225439 [Chaetomium strumarium]|uniref:Uncharacterized protein n=1 Tax=Chaetomium strumarium TaxID=1170767 RepID=A0AAJ0GPU8_9PEZI|nr:hypothetical protein B0T15DRAFT_225439 [Chaetomium strumarium]
MSDGPVRGPWLIRFPDFGCCGRPLLRPYAILSHRGKPPTNATDFREPEQITTPQCFTKQPQKLHVVHGTVQKTRSKISVLCCFSVNTDAVTPKTEPLTGQLPRHIQTCNPYGPNSAAFGFFDCLSRIPAQWITDAVLGMESFPAAFDQVQTQIDSSLRPLPSHPNSKLSVIDCPLVPSLYPLRIVIVDPEQVLLGKICRRFLVRSGLVGASPKCLQFHGIGPSSK